MNEILTTLRNATNQVRQAEGLEPLPESSYVSFDDEVIALLDQYYLSEPSEHNKANRVRQLNALYLKRAVEIIEKADMESHVQPFLDCYINALTNEFGGE